MPSVNETVELVASAATWDERIARIRQIPAHHGTDDQTAIYAQIGRRLYVPHLAPDYAYVHTSDFYEASTFESAYAVAEELTSGFSSISEDDLAAAIHADPRYCYPCESLLVSPRASSPRRRPSSRDLEA